MEANGQHKAVSSGSVNAVRMEALRSRQTELALRFIDRMAVANSIPIDRDIELFSFLSEWFRGQAPLDEWFKDLARSAELKRGGELGGSVLASMYRRLDDSRYRQDRKKEIGEQLFKLGFSLKVSEGKWCLFRNPGSTTAVTDDVKELAREYRELRRW